MCMKDCKLFSHFIELKKREMIVSIKSNHQKSHIWFSALFPHIDKVSESIIIVHNAYTNAHTKQQDSPTYIFFSSPFLIILSLLLPFENSSTTLDHTPVLHTRIDVCIYKSTIYPSISCYFIVLWLNSSCCTSTYIYWHFHFLYYTYANQPASIPSHTHCCKMKHVYFFFFFFFCNYYYYCCCYHDQHYLSSLDSIVHLEFTLLLFLFCNI